MGLLSAVWRRLHKDWAGRRTGPDDRRGRTVMPDGDERRHGPNDRRAEDRRRRPAPMDEELA